MFYNDRYVQAADMARTEAARLDFINKENLLWLVRGMLFYSMQDSMQGSSNSECRQVQNA